MKIINQLLVSLIVINACVFAAQERRFEAAVSRVESDKCITYFRTCNNGRTEAADYFKEKDEYRSTIKIGDIFVEDDNGSPKIIYFDLEKEYDAQQKLFSAPHSCITQ